MRFWIHIPNAHSHFLKQRQGTFFKSRFLHLTNNVCFPLKQPFYRCRWSRKFRSSNRMRSYKISPFGMIGNPSQIGNFVEPLQNNRLLSYSLKLGNNRELHLQEPRNHKISMHQVCKCCHLINNTQLNCLIQMFSLVSIP
jgi:hypothetical protein